MKHIEIERKFLVKDTDFIAQAQKITPITQAFLNTNPERTVRVRIKGEKGYLTIKGKGNVEGVSRFEWEKEIPVSEAQALLPLCEPFPIEKIRYEILFNNFLYEVDIFQGDNQGLIIAEIELKNENQYFERPLWLGEEVTGDIHYYNSYLSKHPYKEWGQKEESN